MTPTVNGDPRNAIELGRDPDWQPIPINAYPRPKGATPRARLAGAGL